MRRFLFNLAIATIAATAPAAAQADDREDQAAAQQIATILRDSGQMKDYSVGVKYKEGTVWLTGRVSNKQQMQAALSVVSDIEGIEQIVNNMTVEKKAASMKQPPAARRVSATSADMMGPQMQQMPPQMQGQMPMQGPMQAGGMPGGGMPGGEGVAPAGYNHLARKAARHACPPGMYAPAAGGGGNPPAYDQPHMPNYAWPSYAAYPNYSALTYPQQYSPTAWPYIGPFYPYPQVPLGWRKVALEWDDGWWFLDFYDRSHH
jgi:hypothetical protein